MSGDKEDEGGEPRKVLGLIWETEADRLKVDVKLNLGAKRAGLHLKENIELSEEPEKALPEAITKRELWRVAQGQYDPLGLHHPLQDPDEEHRGGGSPEGLRMGRTRASKRQQRIPSGTLSRREDSTTTARQRGSSDY
jgi:hypothetical protein